jgi:hypothetical protein
MRVKRVWVVRENSTWREPVSQQNPLGTGRVPQVRQSVPGPKTMGRSLHDRFKLSVKLNPFGAAEPFK